MDAGTPLHRFAALVAMGEDALDLAQAALVVAQDEYPLLDPAPYLQRIDALAHRVREYLPARPTSEESLAALHRVFFSEEDFRGNADDYYNPLNSFLNETLDRKMGLPITLSILYMEIARRAGLPIQGVGLPGHFIVRYADAERFLGVDPFGGGRRLTELDCRALVHRVSGGRAVFRPEHLVPARPFAILTRLLRNLKGIYVTHASPAKALAVIEKMVLLEPGDWTEIRDRGLVRYQLRQDPAALADLSQYLARVPDADDKDDILDLMRIIEKRLPK